MNIFFFFTQNSNFQFSSSSRADEGSTIELNSRFLFGSHVNFVKVLLLMIENNNSVQYESPIMSI